MRAVSQALIYFSHGPGWMQRLGGRFGMPFGHVCIGDSDVVLDWPNTRHLYWPRDAFEDRYPGLALRYEITTPGFVSLEGLPPARISGRLSWAWAVIRRRDCIGTTVRILRRARVPISPFIFTPRGLFEALRAQGATLAEIPR